MATRLQPRIIALIAVVGLVMVSGCQGVANKFFPDNGAQTIPLASANAQGVSRQEPSIPAPAVTPKNYAQVQMALGETLSKEGNFEGAQAAYEAALRNDPSLARAQHRLAIVLERSGNGRDAKPLFLRAMELDPKNAEIVCDYGYWCYLRQDLDEARKQFARALVLDPNLKRAQNNLGLVYARTNRPDDALKQFTLAGLKPAEARTNLGMVYLTQQRMSEAKIELERAVDENPTFDKPRDVLASFERAAARQGQLEPTGMLPAPLAQASAPAAPATAPMVAGQPGPIPNVPAMAPILVDPYPSTAAQGSPSQEAAATVRLLPPPTGSVVR